MKALHLSNGHVAALVCTIAVAMIAGDVDAQVPEQNDKTVGSRIRDREYEFGDAYKRKQARETMATMAKCSVNHNAQRARLLIAADPFSKEAIRMTQVVANGGIDCIGTGIATGVLVTLNEDIIRGAAAEQLVRKDFPKGVPAKRDGVKLPRFADSEELPPAYRQRLFYRNFAACVVELDAPGVHAMLQTSIEEPQEMTALRKLIPTFADCLPPGEQLAISPDPVRGYFAEALYKWSVAQRDGKPG